MKVVAEEVNIDGTVSNRPCSLTCLDVIVQDCLSVLLNLLKNNPSNQSYFRESSYIRRLVDFFELNSIGEQRWSGQKTTNIHLLLQVDLNRSEWAVDHVPWSSIQVIRTLVAPTNSNQNILSCQRTVSQCGKETSDSLIDRSCFPGLLHRLCVMLTLTSIPADVLAEVSVRMAKGSSEWQGCLDDQCHCWCHSWSQWKSTVLRLGDEHSRWQSAVRPSR